VAANDKDHAGRGSSCRGLATSGAVTVAVTNRTEGRKGLVSSRGEPHSRREKPACGDAASWTGSLLVPITPNQGSGRGCRRSKVRGGVSHAGTLLLVGLEEMPIDHRARVIGDSLRDIGAAAAWKLGRTVCGRVGCREAMVQPASLARRRSDLSSRMWPKQ